MKLLLIQYFLEDFLQSYFGYAHSYLHFHYNSHQHDVDSVLFLLCMCFMQALHLAFWPWYKISSGDHSNHVTVTSDNSDTVPLQMEDNKE